MQVCNNHTDLKSIIVPSKNIMFDNSSKLLLCRNAKVFIFMGIQHFDIISCGFKGWLFHMAPSLSQSSKLSDTKLYRNIDINSRA